MSFLALLPDAAGQDNTLGRRSRCIHRGADFHMRSMSGFQQRVCGVATAVLSFTAVTNPVQAAETAAYFESVLHSFSGPDGAFPGSVMMDPSGTIYGTAPQGGTGNGAVGVVFALVPNGNSYD